MTSIRTQLAVKLGEHLPHAWTIYNYGATPTNPRDPVVVVRQRNVRITPGAPRLYRDTDFSIALIVPEIDPKKVENALEESLEALLDSLDELDMDGLIWTGAERVTFEDKFHGYDITATVTNQKEQQ